VIWLVMVAYLVTGLVFAHLVLMNTLSEPCLAGYEADQMVSAVALALLTLVTWPRMLSGLSVSRRVAPSDVSYLCLRLRPSSSRTITNSSTYLVLFTMTTPLAGSPGMSGIT